MPDIATHTAAASQCTALSMLCIAGIGQMLGIDFVALFWAFMGAMVWRGWQPSIAPNFNSISTALGWAMAQMILGTFCGIVAALVALHLFPYLESAGHPVLVGFPAFLLAILCSPIVLKLGELIKGWSRPNA